MSDNAKNKNYSAKQAYQNSADAESYDAQRFSTIRGKLGDMLDKRALLKILVTLPLPQSRHVKLLDIPCGTGRVTRFLLENGYHVTGSDISKQMMDVARTKVDNFDNFGGFFQQDASKLEFEDDSFDCVISIRFMGHIPEEVRLKILKEFYRVSKSAIIEYSIKSKTVTLRRQVDHYLKTGSRLPARWPWHIFEKQELYKELEQVGLRVVRMQAKMPYLSDSYYVLVQRNDDSL